MILNGCVLILVIVGSLPNLVGIIPEKSIKLTVNDILRRRFSYDGVHITMKHELMAASGAGFCQVSFESP